MSIGGAARVHSGAARRASMLLDRFGKRLLSVGVMNWNEVHVDLRSKEDIPELCLFVRDEFKGTLATIVCSDERRISGAYVLRYAFGIGNGDDVFVIVTARVEQGSTNSPPVFPSVALRLPAATLYEREVKDTFGLMPEGNPDTRPLTLHEHWPEGVFPLRKEFELRTKVPSAQGRGYSFLKVDGEGVTEIPVGPVHAGIIEPGHFRFSTLGETIINLETRLFYTHRGVEKLAEDLKLDQVLLLSERVSGDEAVANSSAYCQAVEKIAGVTPPPRALQIRAVCAELERIYNHVGTLAGLSTDVGFAYGAARLNILKERMMRLNEEVAGSRLLFGVNRLGGVGVDLNSAKSQLVKSTIDGVLDDFNRMVRLLRRDSSVMDRLRGTGAIGPNEAAEMGLVGVAARSSGLDVDTRRDHPYGAYNSITISPHYDTPRHITEREVEMATRRGDVLGRFETRVEEVVNSVNMVDEVLWKLDSDPDLVVPVHRQELKPFSHALGYAESHRGQTVHWVMVGDAPDTLFRYKVRTASFANWPAIETAVLNDIVADFPLINKSLDLSYAGNDL
ncbi:MAG TPA: NADH-quinone oxidoreductase subunit C [Nitrososphaerales archaeon]|nr:NADH-quinone oxidoreductase subunit C [Nitrososphaerales archaeon]